MEENQDIRSLKIVHRAQSIGIILIILICHFYVKPLAFDQLSEKMDTMSMIIFGVGILAVIVSFVLFKKMFNIGYDNKISSENYRTAYVVKWGILEAGAMISFLLYYFMELHQIVIISGLLLVILLITSLPKEVEFS